MLAELALLVRDEGQYKELYRMGADDLVEVGPFRVSQRGGGTSRATGRTAWAVVAVPGVGVGASASAGGGGAIQ